MFSYLLANQWLGNRAAEEQKKKRNHAPRPRPPLSLLSVLSLREVPPQGLPPRTKAAAAVGGGPQEAEGARGRHGREAQEGVDASNFAKILMDTCSRNKLLNERIALFYLTNWKIKSYTNVDNFHARLSPLLKCCGEDILI